ncbi:MAG: permease [Betaproteobacteria bacterium]|nr:permease [Betaproteobacteria bacterium]
MVMLAIGAAGMFLCHQLLKSVEVREIIPPGYATILTFVVLGLLLIDLFTYRGVPTARVVASGKLGADWLQAFGVTGWFRPVALSTSYLLTVWHATMLGILIAGLALTVLPRYLKSLFSRTGFAGTLIGALYAMPQPFCSCCAAVMAPSYLRRGASTDFSLSFVVGSPMLNITTIILAFALLSTPFAITRVVAGIVLTVVVTYGVARLAERWGGAPGVTRRAPGASRRGVVSAWVSRGVNLYLRAFNVEAFVRDRKMDTPAELVSAWLYASMRLALVLVPTLFIWSIVTAAIVQILPSTFGNNLTSVVLAAIVGTLLMISTWSEIPVALQLIQSGFTGPAATLLVVLAPVSLPCLMLLGGSLGQFRIVVLLGLAVMITGIVAGVIFL